MDRYLAHDERVGRLSNLGVRYDLIGGCMKTLIIIGIQNFSSNLRISTHVFYGTYDSCT